MKADWNLQDGWHSLQEQIEEGQLFAALANATIPHVDTVGIAVTAVTVMKTGMSLHAYQEWHARWSNVKVFWVEKVWLKKITTNRAGSFGFGMNA